MSYNWNKTSAGILVSTPYIFIFSLFYVETISRRKSRPTPLRGGSPLTGRFAALLRSPAPRGGLRYCDGVIGTVRLFSVILSDPNDLTAFEKYSKEEHTLRKLKATINRIRSIALKIMISGHMENQLLKETEATSKLLYLLLKEEREALKQWPFSAPQRSLNLLKESENIFEQLINLTYGSGKQRFTSIGDHLVLGSLEEHSRKRKLTEERYTTNLEENGGMDTVDKKTSSSTTSMDG